MAFSAAVRLQTLRHKRAKNKQPETLMELSKLKTTTAEQFLTVARKYPEQLKETEDAPEWSQCRRCDNIFTHSTSRFCRRCGEERHGLDEIIESEAESGNESAGDDSTTAPLSPVLVSDDQCMCGQVFMPDSKFCRKCGQPRPVHAKLSKDTCNGCKTPFARDANYCRMCGEPRPRNSSASGTPRFNTFDVRDYDSGGSGLARGFRRLSTPFDLRTLMRMTSTHKYENSVSVMHYFLVNCLDLDGETLFEINSLNPTVLCMTTSFLRTPVHHMMERREGTYRADILIAIEQCHSGSFCRRDLYNETPLDRYFEHNEGQLDVTSDPVVEVLCRLGGDWGFDALVNSTRAYTDDALKDGSVLEKYRVLAEGNPFQVETFVKQEMNMLGSPEQIQAKLKFLFLTMPLRSPTKYGMTSSQGLQFVAKVCTATADAYAEATNPRQKQVWLEAFTDVCMSLIKDEDLLRGMKTDPPSNQSVEALSSTEIMSTVLTYKFMQGPILVFAFEFSLFSILFTLIVWQISVPVPNVAVVCLAIFITVYFAIREVAQMVEGRREEMKLYKKQDADEEKLLRIRKSQNEVGALHDALRAKQSTSEKEHGSTARTTGAHEGAGGHGGELNGARTRLFHHTNQNKAAAASDDASTAKPANHDLGDIELSKLVRVKSIMHGKLGAARLNVKKEENSDGLGTVPKGAAEVRVLIPANSCAAEAEGPRRNIAPPPASEMKADDEMDPEPEESSLDDEDTKLEGAQSGGGEDADSKKSPWDIRRIVWSSRDSSRFITVYLFMPVSWRSDAFNWVDVGMVTSCFMAEAHLLHHAVEYIKMDADEGDASVKINQSEYTLRAICILFLWLEFFGFLKGTSMKMATFILMIQEILVNVDAFIFVFLCIVVMYAMMYHVLLRDEEGISEWRDFDVSLWQTWTYSLGEFDDVAFQTDHASVLFSALMLVVVIIMMNILIAIVSDSYTDAMNRSGPLFWRARLDLIAEYEGVLPKLHEKKYMDLEDHETAQRMKIMATRPPETWQYKCLMFQEGLLATAIVCGIVLFELLFVEGMENETDKLITGLSISVFFLAEIILRAYTWWHTFRPFDSRKEAVRGYCKDIFRLTDTLIVLLDWTALIIVQSLQASSVSGDGGGANKGHVKLGRMLRFLKAVRIAKTLRSCRFVSKLVWHWRRMQSPDRATAMESIKANFAPLEDNNAWAGRTLMSATSKSRKYDLERSSSQVISHTQMLVENVSARITETNNHLQRVERSLESMRAQNSEVQSEIMDLKNLLRKKDTPTPSSGIAVVDVAGFFTDDEHS